MNTPNLRRSAIRRAFDRAAPSYDAAAGLQREVAVRLDERLEAMRIAPARILDAGCGTGLGLPLLRRRYAEAALTALDLAPGMLQQARQALPQSWLSRLARRSPRVAHVCGDIEQLPFGTDRFDMVWSSLALQWVGDLEGAFRQFRRVLRPDGLLIFATFGPDTLKELRQAFAGVDGYGHVNRFLDMHDIGDMLVHAGFASPVMEMEYITVTYPDLKGVLGELKAIGAHTVLEGSRNGLMGKREWQRLTEAYERFRTDGRLPATYEVVYGHAWAGAKDRLEDGRQVIRMQIERKRGGL